MAVVAMLGIDLGKNSCSVAGLDDAGRVVLRRRVPWDRLVELLAKLDTCVVAMEACCGAHHVGRLAQAEGHQVRLMPPEWEQRTATKRARAEHHGRESRSLPDPALKYQPHQHAKCG